MTHSDQTIADMLTGTPPLSGAAFRIEVLMRIAERTQRRTALRRALRHTAIFALFGLSVPALNATGLSLTFIQPLAIAACTIGLTFVGALIAIKGPTTALARLRILMQLSV